MGAKKIVMAGLLCWCWTGGAKRLDSSADDRLDGAVSPIRAESADSESDVGECGVVPPATGSADTELVAHYQRQLERCLEAGCPDAAGIACVEMVTAACRGEACDAGRLLWDRCRRLQMRSMGDRDTAFVIRILTEIVNRFPDSGQSGASRKEAVRLMRRQASRTE